MPRTRSFLILNSFHFLTQVTCYCGKPFAGRPMIECSKCEIWIHLKCAGLRRNNIPDTWHCKKCKTLKQPATSLKSDKVSGSRKRKSTKFQQRKKDGEKTVQHQQQPLASTSSAASLAASITSSKETDQSQLLYFHLLLSHYHAPWIYDYYGSF